MTDLYDEVFNAPETAVVVEEEEPLTDEMHSLIYLGRSEDTVRVAGHEIKLRTLKIGEELEATLLAKQWSDTAEAGRALATALVAAAIVSVDGNPLYLDLGPRQDTLEGKFDYIRSNWHWMTVRTVYQKYDDMLKAVLDAHEEMLKD